MASPLANPLIKLELMRRFRSPASAWGIPLLMLLPGFAVSIIYVTATRASQAVMQFDQFGNPVPEGRGGVAVEHLQGIGIGMFVAVLVTMLLALLLMVPSKVGGSIAGERQNQTLQPLQLTAMSPTQIVGGKLVSSLAYLLVLLLCAAPVMAIPFLLGGIGTVQVLGAYAVLVLITVQFAAISLAVSSAMSRPAPAVMVSLVICALLVVAPWVVMGIGFVMVDRGDPMFEAGDSLLRYIASLSPVSLGSWVPLGVDDADSLVRTGDRIASLVWYLSIVAGALWFARSRVVAPVERDR